MQARTNRHPNPAAPLRRALGCLIALASLFPALGQAQTPADPYTYSRQSKFEYYGAGDGAKAGLLKKEWVEQDNANSCVETEYSHDAHGNKTGAVTRNCAGASGDALFAERSSSSNFAAHTATIRVRQANGTYKPDADITLKLARKTNAGGSTTGWQITARATT